ncbi:putative fucosyltransferase [Trifolium repens]|nr:putative fucosyltransferase [Trifolium repens]
MEASYMRLKMSFIVCLIVLPIVIMVTLMYQNSSFGLFEGFSKGMSMRGMTHTTVEAGVSNVTTNELELRQNVTHDNFGGRHKSDNIFKSSKNIPLTNSTSTLSKHMKDKLLDGLLVSGFDEASCISRSQSHFNHKSSPHKPSPYLISKLRKYEELHRKCGPNTRAYNKDMKIIVNSKSNGTHCAATTCKYIIWVPVNGLGNQIISMASTFLYAILTERVMLVQGKDIEGLFCEPFLNSTWLLPKDSPFWNNENNRENVKAYQSTIEKEMNHTLNEDLPSTMFIDMKFTGTFEERFFHCDHSQFLLSKIPLLSLTSGQYFVPAFFMTPIFQKELNKMFPEITSIFHHLGRYLFHPSNEAWEQITNFYQQHLAKANERIGLQIRVFKPDSTPQQVVMNQVLNCTLENKLLPKVLDTKNISFSEKNKTNTKVVLVASLYPQYGNNLKTMYQNKSTVTGEVIEVYQPSGEEEQKFGDNKHNLKAWVDIYLLSLSDVLVTTYQSTFGYVAKGLGNSIPWILYNPVNNQNKEICEAEFTKEPCYHYAPLHHCNGAKFKDISSSFHNIRHCKDYPFGVKLVKSSV